MALQLDPSAPGWARSLVQQLDKTLLRITGRSDRPFKLPEFAVADLPDPAKFRGCHINVPDEAGGYTSAFSDGTHFRRVQDRAIVS